MKRVIIFEHDGGELANQLWNYASIYAYCLERGYACENWSFFEYAKYFANLEPRSLLVRLIFFWPFKRYHKRRGARLARAWRRLYKVLVVLPTERLARSIYHSRNPENTAIYLPPTNPASAALAALEARPGRLFFAQNSGGVFRNPVGMAQYRKEIRAHFAPAADVAASVSARIEPLRARYAHLVGVHVRQGDYKNFKGGKFAVSQQRVRQILDEYLAERRLSADETCFVVASDGRIDLALFDGLSVVLTNGTPGVDLFTLAACDAVVGSESTFGHFAAWLGDVPHIILKNEPIDWAYYRDKRAFFSPHTYLGIMHQ